MFDDLTVAIMKGDISLARKHLESGIDVDSSIMFEEPSLCAAAAYGNEEFVRLLLEYGAQVDVRNKDHATPLMHAAANGHENIVRLLLEHGAEPHAITAEGVTVLMAAAGSIDASVEIPMYQTGGTKRREVKALQAAQKERKLTIARLLLDLGLDVNAISEKGSTALLIALFGGHNALIELFQEHGAQVGFLEAVAMGDLELANRLPIPDAAERSAHWGALLMHWTARHKRHDLLEYLLQRGLNPNSVRGEGHPVLMTVVMRQDLDAARLLLRYGADVDSRTSSTGIAPLGWAANFENPAMAKLLLEHGADPNRVDTNDATPLTKAVMQNNLETARVLLEAGANPNQGAIAGAATPPLMFAMTRNSPEMVKLLLEFGAEQATGTGMKAAEFATLQSTPEVAAVLREASGADLPTAAKQGDLETVKQLLDAGRSLESRDDQDNTALIVAAEQGHTELVRLLLERGADVNATNKIQMSALAHAVMQGHTEVATLLLAHRADPTRPNAGGYTPLMFAVSRNHPELRDLLLHNGVRVGPVEAALLGNLDTLRQLLDRGAEVDTTSTGGLTLLMTASLAGHAEVAQALLHRGADINRQDAQGHTALHYAVSHQKMALATLLLEHGIDPNRSEPADPSLFKAALMRDLDMIRLLIVQGADVNRPGKFGTALHRAIVPIEGYEEVVRLLLEAGADVNARAPGLQMTPLMQACSYGSSAAIVRLLLAHGADVHAKIEQGRTAFGFAMDTSQEPNPEVAKLLLEAGANPREDELLFGMFGLRLPAFISEQPELAPLLRPFFKEDEEENKAFAAMFKLDSFPSALSSDMNTTDMSTMLDELKKRMGFARDPKPDEPAE